MSDKKKKILVNSIIIAAAALTAVSMVYFEVVKRAKREYKEGEMHLSFHRDPALKTSHYNRLLEDNKITEPQYKLLMEDKSLKNAYIQYQTVIDLFTPPESKWVKLSRERLREIEPEYNAWVKQLNDEIQAAKKTPQ
ncbi:MAG: hypothetical protein ACLFP1_02885 [Candidatus Goldiibacteriota bacterium]